MGKFMLNYKGTLTVQRIIVTLGLKSIEEK